MAEYTADELMDLVLQVDYLVRTQANGWQEDLLPKLLDAADSVARQFADANEAAVDAEEAFEALRDKVRAALDDTD
jgi:hypothetical protein